MIRLPVYTVRHLFWGSLVWLLFSLSTIVIAATFTDTSCSGGEFDSAILDGVECTSNALQLDATGLLNGYGTSTSQIFDGGGPNASWSTIGWSPTQPYGKELPSSTVSDTGYTTGTIDMTNNVLYFRMNEDSWSGASNEVIDYSGNGNHGTAQGGATTAAGGMFHRAGEFDGVADATDQYIVVSDADSLDITNAITIAAWVYSDSLLDPNDNNSIIEKRNPSSARPSSYGLLVREATGKLAFQSGTAGSWLIDQESTIGIAAGAWYHVAVTYDRSYVKFYIDGKPAGVFAETDALTVNSYVLTIGRTGNDFYHWDGKIDEIAIWSEALTATDIQNIYKRGAHKLKFQLRSCDDSACSGESFVGPNGAADYYSENTTTTNAVPSKALVNIADNQYFQYRTVFESSSSTITPVLEDVTITYTPDNAGYTVPEFSDYVYVFTLIVGFWYAARRVLASDMPTTVA